MDHVPLETTKIDSWGKVHSNFFFQPDFGMDPNSPPREKEPHGGLIEEEEEEDDNAFETTRTSGVGEYEAGTCSSAKRIML